MIIRSDSPYAAGRIIGYLQKIGLKWVGDYRGYQRYIVCSHRYVTTADKIFSKQVDFVILDPAAGDQEAIRAIMWFHRHHRMQIKPGPGQLIQFKSPPYSTLMEAEVRGLDLSDSRLMLELTITQDKISEYYNDLLWKFSNNQRGNFSSSI